MTTAQLPTFTVVTTVSDVVVAAFRSLDLVDQREAARRINDVLALAQSEGKSEADFHLAQLRKAADEMGVDPVDLTADLYRTATATIRARGEEHLAFRTVTEFFGSWSRCKEALGLSETTTAKRIEARFNERKLGKIWRYSDETLAHWISKAVEEFGRVPQVAEFTWWRERELSLAKARQDDTLHIPSPTPYRKRWKTWDAAMLALGYSETEVAERLERSVDTTGGREGLTVRPRNAALLT